MAGSVFFDGIVDEFSTDLSEILDFPLETVEGEGDDLDGGDWNEKFERLGPIPLEAMLGPSFVSGCKVRNLTSEAVPGLYVHGDRSSELKTLPKLVGRSISLENKCTSVLGPRVLQTPSPVAIHEPNSSCSGEKNVSVSSDIIIPTRPPGKRSRSATISRWLVTPPMFPKSDALPRPNDISESDLGNTITNPAKRKLMEEKKLSRLSGATEMIQNSSRQLVEAITCSHCKATMTPLRREGPMGPHSLCNVCGVRYKSGHLFADRPAASPTLVPYLHLNSSKKVFELRNKAIQRAAMALSKPQMSPLNACEESSELQTMPKFAEDASRGSISCQNDYSSGLKFGGLQSTSPVSVLESSCSCSGEKNMSTSSEILVPVYTHTEQPESAAISLPVLTLHISPKRSPHVAASEALPRSNDLSKSDRANTIAYPVKRKRQKDKKLSDCKVTEPPEWMDDRPMGAKRQYCKSGCLFPEHHPAVSPSKLPGTKMCSHCKVTKTPQWRKGPMGPQSLCNACGMRYRKYGSLFSEYRPSSSTTFVPALHSNFNNKVFAMRGEVIRGAAMTEKPEIGPRMSPPPEFMPRSSSLFDCIIVDSSSTSGSISSVGVVDVSPRSSSSFDCIIVDSNSTPSGSISSVGVVDVSPTEME